MYSLYSVRIKRRTHIDPVNYNITGKPGDIHTYTSQDFLQTNIDTKLYTQYTNKNKDSKIVLHQKEFPRKPRNKHSHTYRDFLEYWSKTIHSKLIQPKQTQNCVTPRRKTIYTYTF
jgi:hypothetical protein